MPHTPCPHCGTRTAWVTAEDPANFRRQVLRCAKCGFEVDAHVVRTSKRILRRAGGKAEPVSES